MKSRRYVSYNLTPTFESGLILVYFDHRQIFYGVYVIKSGILPIHNELTTLILYLGPFFITTF